MSSQKSKFEIGEGNRCVNIGAFPLYGKVRHEERINYNDPSITPLTMKRYY